MTDLITTEWFDSQKESRPIRFIQDQDTTVIPIQDIAQATGLRKRSLLNILDKHKDDFREHARDVRLSTPGGYQQVRCIDRDGAMMLLFKISTGHIKREDIKIRLNSFREWQIKKMGQPISLPALPAQKEPDYEAALRAARFAKELSGITGTDPIPLICQALDKYELGAYGGLLVPKERPLLPAAPPKPKLWMVPTEIGDLIGKTAKEVNQWLWNNDLQRKDTVSGEWRITPKGKDAGGEERYGQFESGHYGWHIVWKKSVLGLFNVHEEMG